jgi:hypothetical protein
VHCIFDIFLSHLFQPIMNKISYDQNFNLDSVLTFKHII